MSTVTIAYRDCEYSFDRHSKKGILTEAKGASGVITGTQLG